MTSTDDHDITNAERAERCNRALETYNDAWDVRSNLIDLLADLRHWCDAHKHCFGDLDRTAHQHYLAEIGEGRRP